MSAPGEPNTSLEQAYRIAHRQASLPGLQRKIDDIENSNPLYNQLPNAQFLNASIQANRGDINDAAEDVTSFLADNKVIQDAVDGFTESAKVIIKGLDEIAKLHPFVGVAVMAFKLVVTLDLTRRENNNKVVIVKVQMQEMICELFRLRDIKDPDAQGPDGIVLKDRIQELLSRIVQDIKECGSACDVYMKKSFMGKLLKSPFYEARLAAYGELFQDHRDNLAHALSIHTTLEVHAIKEKMGQQSLQLETISGKLDMVLAFRRLDTTREKDVMDFIESNGGPKACIDRDELLQELMRRSGESVTTLIGTQSGAVPGENLTALRKTLLKELSEDVDEVMKKNIVLFEGKLNIQSERIADVIHQEGKHIIRAFSAGAHEYVKDPNLRALWKDMGWKGSVKARHFVLALRDYYTDKFTFDPLQSAAAYPATPYPPSPRVNDYPSQQTPSRNSFQDDRWALAYINATYLQPILEAVDDDASGFINIKEANTFSLDRPPEWSLLQWLAFWAAGWHLSISNYRSKIYAILGKMHRLLDKVLPSNRRIVDEYLGHWSLIRLELLLRSTNTAPDHIHDDFELNSITGIYVNMEEMRLNRNLQAIAYNIDSPATVPLVTGPGRIERYIYPIIYLLLEQHFRVIQLSCKHVLNMQELFVSSTSLNSMFSVYWERLFHLKAIFSQTRLDVDAQLRLIAFGMFNLLSISDNPNPAQNTIMTLQAYTDITQLTGEDVDISNLKYGIEDTLHVTSSDFVEIADSDLTGKSLEGSWNGVCYLYTSTYETISPLGLLHFTLEILDDGSGFKGDGECFLGSLKVEGSMEPEREWDHRISFVVHDGTRVSCIVSYHSEREYIEGNWFSDGRSGMLYFCRTPSDLLRYRFPNYVPEVVNPNAARTRWSFACSAVLHIVKRRLWSWSFFKDRIRDRRRYMHLAIIVMSRAAYPSLFQFTDDEWKDLKAFTFSLSTSDAKLYYAIAKDQFARLPYLQPEIMCDICSDASTRTKLVCINCMDINFLGAIVICVNCIEKPVSVRGFNHDCSHSLIKSDNYIHNCQFAWLIPTGRAVSKRLKEYFRDRRNLDNKEVEPNNFNLTVNDQDTSVPVICACCKLDITLPCWVCLRCLPTFICQECETKRLPGHPEGPSPIHMPYHFLLWVHNDTEESLSVDSTNPLERKLDALNEKFGSRLSALESRVDKLHEVVEAKVEQRLDLFEERIEKRLVSIEEMIDSRLSSISGDLADILRRLNQEHTLKE